MRTLSSILFVSALCAAQETTTRPPAADPLRFVPRDAVLVVKCKGFGGWGEEFAKTGLGKVVAAGALARPWQAMWSELEKDAPLDAAERTKLAAALETLGSHRGEITLGLAVDFGPMLAAKPPELLVSLAMTGADAELERIATAISGLLPDDGADRSIAGEPMKLHAVEDFEVTAPFRRDGALVMLLGNDLDRQAASCLEPHESSFALVPAVAAAPFAVQAEIGTVVQSLVERLQQSTDEEHGKIAKAVVEFGGTAVRRAWLTMAADGPWVAQRSELEYGDGPRGVLDCFLPVRKGPPRLLRLVPAAAANWSVSAFDFEALFASYVKAFAMFGDDAPMSREELEAKFTEFTKLRLHEDVLALLGGEHLRIDDAMDAMDVDEEELEEPVERFDMRWGDSCYAIALRDGKALAANVEKALRSRGLHAARKTEEYGDVKIHRLKLLGAIDLEYAFAGDLLVYGIGGGEGTARNLRGILDGVAAQQRGEPAPELPAPLRQRLEGMDGDWTTIDVATFADVLDALGTSMDALSAIATEEDLEDPQVRPWVAIATFGRALRAELVRHRAETTVTVGRFRADGCTWRSRW